MKEHPIRSIYGVPRERILRWVIGLEEHEIFVFGSNTSGIHGAGAAKQAMEFGATYGQAIGLSGQTYAIPTMKYINNKFIQLPLSQVHQHVIAFLSYATANPGYDYLVTEIGCGLAGFHPQSIAPMFRKAINMENIILPKSFWDILIPNKP